MTLMRMFFSGQIKRCEHREAGGKPLEVIDNLGALLRQAE